MSAIDNEKRIMWELIQDTCNDLDIDSVCHKILRNVSALVSADRSVEGHLHGQIILSQGDKRVGYPNRRSRQIG